MNSHDKTHSYPAGYAPIPGEENVHGNPKMKKGVTKAVKANKAANKKATSSTIKSRKRGK